MNPRSVRFVAVLLLSAWTLLAAVPALEAFGRLEATPEASHHGLETALLSATRHCVLESRIALDRAPVPSWRCPVAPTVDGSRLSPPSAARRVPVPPPDDPPLLRHKLLSVYRL